MACARLLTDRDDQSHPECAVFQLDRASFIGRVPMDEITISADGFTVDAHLLAAAFGLEPASISERLRTGQITSQCETGVDEDAGRWRLTFFHGGRALRLIVDAEGILLSRATFPAHLPHPQADGRPDGQG